MSHKTLHELAKFGSGLVAGDFIANAWIAYMGYYPIAFLGWTFTESIVLPALVFDAALFLILIHYGWNIGKIPALRERTYLMLVGTVFAVIAAAHLFRVFFNADLVIMGWSAPMWLSWIGTLVVAYLAYMSFRLGMRMR
jgi:hypothetical protein